MRRFFQFVVLAAAVTIAAADGYHVIKQIKIGGDTRWDYVTIDSAARRLYVSHETHVVVLDVDSGKVVGDIPDTPGVHGIAVAPALNRGFISNGRANDVTIFDLKTLKAIGKVKTGENPDAILYEPASGRVFTFNGRTKDSTAINAKTGTVEGTIPLGGAPEFAVLDGKGKIYDNTEDTNEMVEVDVRKLSVTKRYSLSPCDAPSGLAMDVKNRRLFSVCRNKIMIVSDPDSGKILANLPIGQGTDGALFDPTRGFAFSANGDGTLTVVRETSGKWEVVGNVATQRNARTMALDTKTHNIYLPTADLGPAPAPTAETPRPRPSVVPDTFRVVVVGY